MSSTSSSSKSRRSSILKVRQPTEAKIDVPEQPKNRRRVSFHHQKTVKNYDKEKHDLSATSPIKEAVKEAMSDFDSTKSNSTVMSLGTPDRTTGENHSMMLFRGMMSGGQPSSVHYEATDMSFSILEDPAHPVGFNDTLNIFNGMNHISIHSTTVDISCRMEESMNENAADNTMNIFKKPSMNQSTRAISNMTMDMDISKMNNTLTEGAFDEEDTMAVFGKRTDTTLPLNSTLDALMAGSGSSDKSRMSQSILMDMSANPSPLSSQDHTLAVFGRGSQSDESVAMEEATMIEEEEKRAMPEKSPIHPSLPEKELNESTSPRLDDTMAVFGLPKTHETGDDDVPMEMSMGGQQPSQNDPVSPTMNIFKRKGEEDTENDETINVFGSKRWREEGDMSLGEEGETMQQRGSQEIVGSHQSLQGSQKSVSMDEVDATINVFGVKTDETMNESVAMDDDEEGKEEKERNESIAEISTRTAVECTQKTATTASSSGDRTLDIFNGLAETSQTDLTDAVNATFDVVKIGGDVSQMDMSGGGNETLGVFGKKGRMEEEEEEGEKTLLEEGKEDEEDKKEESVDETPSVYQSTVEDKTIPSENGSEDMMDETPLLSQSPVDGLRRKTRLSTVIEVSSRYTAASSQSMRQKVESTENESMEKGILDRMDDDVFDKEDEKTFETGVEKSTRMEEEESMAESPTPSGSNTTLSATFTRRSMLDETRLSDRSMMNITRSYEDFILEKIDWMRREREEGGEMDGIIKEHAAPFAEETNKAIERSESSVEDLLSQITQSGSSDLLIKSIVKLNPAKVQEYRVLFEWARREAQREWWEMRAEKAENVNREMVEKMKKDEEELEKAKDDLIMMSKLNELKEDVESLEKEVKVGRGLSRNRIDELIGSSKKKEEEKERLQREVTRMELESMKQSTMALKIMAERCHAVDESIKRKMEERVKNKRELKAYLSQLTNNLK